jgi:hypothetical protein
MPSQYRTEFCVSDGILTTVNMVQMALSEKGYPQNAMINFPNRIIRMAILGVSPVSHKPALLPGNCFACQPWPGGEKEETEILEEIDRVPSSKCVGSKL